jgi:hypothetical protein
MAREFRTLCSSAFLLLIALAASLTSGCRGFAPVSDGEHMRKVVVIPFIEEVMLPEALEVGKVAVITVRFSAMLGPELLQGSVYDWGSGGVLNSGGDSGIVVDERGFYLGGDSQSIAPPPGDTVTFNIIATHPGTYTLRLGTTKSRETGGTRVETVVRPSFIFPAGRDPFIYREFVIEVLPAP